jgi:hypothetical protein
VTFRSLASRALLALAALVLASPARGAELLIAAPSACVLGDELSFRAERALGQPLDTAADVRCTVHITRDGAAYAARLEVQAIASPEPSRLRSFRAPSCELLTETLALAVSLAIASGAPEPEPAAPGVGPAPDAAPAAHAIREPAADTGDAGEHGDGSKPVSADGAREWRFGGSAGVVADAGTLPGIGMGAALGVSLGVDAFDLRLLGTYLPPRDAQVSSAATSAAGSPGAEIELLSGSLLGCVPRLVSASNLALGLCAGGELGRLSGRGTGVTIARSGTSVWASARADAEARWMLAPALSFDFRLSALIPAERDEFSIDDDRVFRTGAVAGRATVGLSYELGAASR